MAHHPSCQLAANLARFSIPFVGRIAADHLPHCTLLLLLLPNPIFHLRTNVVPSDFWPRVVSVARRTGISVDIDSST